MDAMQRGARPGKPLSECQTRRNQCVASKRAWVEHVFAGIWHMGGTIGQTRATVAMTMMAICYDLKRLASFLHRGSGCVLQTRKRLLQGTGAPAHLESMSRWGPKASKHGDRPPGRSLARTRGS